MCSLSSLPPHRAILDVRALLCLELTALTYRYWKTARKFKKLVAFIPISQSFPHSLSEPLTTVILRLSRNPKVCYATHLLDHELVMTERLQENCCTENWGTQLCTSTFALVHSLPRVVKYCKKYFNIRVKKYLHYSQLFEDKNKYEVI